MYIAIDIGGTKTDIGFYQSQDPSSSQEVVRLATNQDFQQAQETIFSEIQKQIDPPDIEGIGVSFPGIVDQAGQIIQASNIPDYEGKPLQKLLEQTFDVPVRIIQDAACSGVAELLYGNIRQYSKAVHLILGTGLGGSFIQVSQNKTVVSPMEPCGLIVDASDGRSQKFNRTQGLLEAYVSGGGVEHFYQVKLADVPDDDAIWNEITDYLAIGINNLNCLLKPEIVVIGGGIGQKRQPALQSVKDKVTQYDEFVAPPKVDFTQVKGNSSLIGALAVNFVDNLELEI